MCNMSHVTPHLDHPCLVSLVNSDSESTLAFAFSVNIDMGEVVNVVVAFAVVILIVRWATTSTMSLSLCCTHFVIQSVHMRWRVHCGASCRPCSTLQAEESDSRDGMDIHSVLSSTQLIYPNPGDDSYRDVPRHTTVRHPAVDCTCGGAPDFQSSTVPTFIMTFSALVLSNSLLTRSSSVAYLMP